MPALVLFGHRTPVAGDDLRINCIVMLLFRIFQLLLIVTLLVLSFDIDRDDFEKCREEGNLSDVTRNANVIFYVYWSGAVLLDLASLSTELAIWRTSVKGTPTQPEKRRSLVPLCTVKLVPLNVVRIVLFVLAAILITNLRKYCDCFNSGGSGRILLEFNRDCEDYDAFYRVLAVLGFTHLLEVCFSGVFAVWLFWNRLRPRRTLYSLTGERSKQQSWALTCQICCRCTSLITCCLFGGRESGGGDFTDVSMALADYFDDGGKLDVTFSDIIAGLLMLVRVQQQRQIEDRELLLKRNRERDTFGVDLEPEKMKSHLESEVLQEEKVKCSVDPEIAGNASVTVETNPNRTKAGEVSNRLVEGPQTDNLEYHRRPDVSHLEYEPVVRNVLSRGNAQDVAAIGEGAHFIRVANAIYAWLMYFKNHTCTAHCVFVGTWLCDLLGCSPHRCCCKQKRHIVGDNCCGWNETALLRMSGIDASNIAYAQFRFGVSVTPYCIAIDHDWKSIVLAVRGTLSLDDVAADVNICPEPLDKLGERCGFDGEGEYCHGGILACAEWIYSDLQSHRILEELLLGDKIKYPGYRLRIVGHSLGAGVGAVLSLMLRSRFPDLRCTCYEPPGCVLSERASTQCRSYVTSWVNGGDIIPRMSLQSLENLRNDILEMIARIKVPKHEVFEASWKKRGTDIEDVNGTFLHKKRNMPPSEFIHKLEEFKKHQQQQKLERDMADVPLYLPGKIIHLVASSEPKSCLKSMFSNPDPCTAQWAMNANFNEILISSHMISDHHGHRVCEQLELLASSYGLQPPYTSDEGVNSS